MLELKNAVFAAGGANVIDGVDLAVGPGEVLGVIGRAGSGKTSLLKLLAGAIKPASGEALFRHRPLHSIPLRERSGLVSFMEEYPGNMDERVYDFILLARMPYKKIFNPFSDYDRQVADDAVAMFDLDRVAGRSLESLSADFLRRTMLAYLFAREAGVMILDNPSADLDLSSERLLQRALAKYSLDGRRGAVLASNDLNFIAQTADRIIVLDGGRIALSGGYEIIREETVREFFGLDVFISRNVYNGKPNVHFFPES